MPIANAKSTEDCSKYSKYDYCYGVSDVYRYGSAYAAPSARIEVNLDDSGKEIGGNNYFIDTYSAKYVCQGSGNVKAYYVSDDDIGNINNAANNCDKNGCPYLEITKKGTRELKGEIDDFGLICWSYELSEEDGDTAWAWVASQWSFEDKKIRTVECYENENCGVNVCNKDGEWNTWRCEPKPIDPCEGIVCDSKCYDDITILTKGYCEAGACKYKETRSCDDNDPLTIGDKCVEKEIPIDQYLVHIALSVAPSSSEVVKTKLQAYCTYDDKVECVKDSDCNDGDKYTIRDWCESNICMHSQKVQCLTDEDCNAEEFCDGNNCREDTVVENIDDFLTEDKLDVTTSPSVLEDYRSNKNYIIISLVIVAILLSSGVIFLVIKLKK